MHLNFEDICFMITCKDVTDEKKLALLNEQIGVRNREISKMDEWKDIIFARIAKKSDDPHMKKFVEKMQKPLDE